MALNVPASLVPAYEQAAAATGVPIGILEAQDYIESGFNPNAVSPAGAQGIAQFIPSTAAAFGLTNPFDPASSIMAQAKYDAQLAQQNAGDWVKALTQYSGGANPADYALKILGLAGGAVGSALSPSSSGGGSTIGSAISSLPGSVGHGLANALTASFGNVTTFAKNNAVPLVVALVVALVLFGGAL